MKKIILLGVIAVMLLLTASTAMADTIVWQIGVFDDLYGVTDGTKVTTSPDRSTAPKGTVTVDYTDVSTFYSVLVPVTTITGTFTADLSKGAVLLVSWSPGASYPSEQFSVTLDGTTKSSQTVAGSRCTSDPPGGRCGQVPSYYSNYPGLPYYTEIFDFGPGGSGMETHTLSINYAQGDGIGFDYLKLSTPALDHFLGYKVKTTKVCDGGVTLLTLKNNGPAGNITVTTKGGVVFAEDVDSGAEFSFGTQGVKLGTSITITTIIGDVESATTIHTSCSQPIYSGLAFGDFEVMEGESLRGGPLETPAPDFFPHMVDLADQFEMGVFTVEKPDKLYNPVDKNGEGINDHNTHLMGYKIKPVEILEAYPPFHECAPCKGGLTYLKLQYNGSPSALIVVTAGIENEQLFGDGVESGGTFEVFGTGEYGKLSKEINIWVDDKLATTIHTSCSQPIGTGQTFEDFTVVAGASKDGGPLCPIIKVESQLGMIFVAIDKADRLLVPTAKSQTGPVDPLEETGVDHFKGYKIKAPKAPKDTPKITVTLVDQFFQLKTYIVEKPTRLFVPVSKGVEQIKNPEAHLICYKIKPAEGEEKHIKVLDIYTRNQFGWLKLDTHKEEELLVPCNKIIQLGLLGDWDLQYVWLPSDKIINHNMSITTENPDGSFSGTGDYAGPYPPPHYTWNVSGTVIGNSVSMTITYDQTVAGTYPYIVSLTGTVGAGGNSMSGDATDSFGYIYTWTATHK